MSEVKSLHTANTNVIRRRRRLLTTGIIIAVAWTAAAACLCVSGLTMPDGRADLAVVFGNALTIDGLPEPILLSRLEVAIQCYRSGACPRLFVSGSIDGPGRDEAAAMRHYLLTHGVPDSCITVDRAGDNTLATARNALAYMRAHNLSRVLLVTQYYHLARARYAFERAGAPTVYGDWPHAFRLTDLYASWREVPAFAIYRIRLGLNPDARPVSVRPMLFLFRLVVPQT
ncbi:YdcF family protein [Paraburkholderia sp. Tr-20389]|uniref:YdcF family protein n=1 Tax=Paraburkholderia sp. Tr-20389 TaxID=2703903 RepID=UPI00197F4ED2|nr:YdcF family protein [Paraburkholderia sp. Tr-20389]MBN3751655.1 YdcF family protein [Paraburkholderia sp. Tr-20389]